MSPDWLIIPWVSNNRLSQLEEQRCEPHQGPSRRRQGSCGPLEDKMEREEYEQAEISKQV